MKHRLSILFVSLMVGASTCSGEVAGPVPTVPGAEVAQVPPAVPQRWANVLSVSPNASQVALDIRSGGDGEMTQELKLYDTVAKKWVDPQFTVPADEKLMSLLFSPDGQWQLAHFLRPRLERSFRVYRVRDMREVIAIHTEGHEISPAAFSADGSLLVRPAPREGDKPFRFVVVDLATATVQSTLQIDLKLLSHGMFHRIAFTPDRKWVYSHQDDRVLIWNVASGQMATYWTWTGTGTVAAMGSTPDGRFIRALMAEGSVASFDTSTTPLGQQVSRLDVPPVNPKEGRIQPFVKPWSFNQADFSTDAASVMRDAGGKIDVYDLQSGKLVRTITLPAGVEKVDFKARHGELVPVHLRNGSLAIVELPK
jgi:WD40 repeat protein